MIGVGRPTPGLVAYLPAGWPSRERFVDLVQEVASVVDVVEVGVPFTDPMADGATLRRASAAALAGGASVRWLVEALPPLPVPVYLMSYLNPLLAYGFDALRRDLPQVAGYVVPDLPLDEAAPLPRVQMVTPLTPEPRRRALAAASHGFLYAVSGPGTTGGRREIDAGFLRGLRAHSPVPVCVGFGVRDRAQVEALRGAVDGVIVGTALVEGIEAGRSARELLTTLRVEA